MGKNGKILRLGCVERKKSVLKKLHGNLRDA